jgi:hypothetical protein
VDILSSPSLTLPQRGRKDIRARFNLTSDLLEGLVDAQLLVRGQDAGTEERPGIGPAAGDVLAEETPIDSE